MKPLSRETLAVLEIVAEQDGADGEEGIRLREIAQLLRAQSGRRLEQLVVVAVRVRALRLRGLVVEFGDRVYPTVRGLDVAEGGMRCRECGCTDNDACADGCGWAEADLCTSCAVGLVLA